MNLYGLIGYPLTHSFSQQYFTEKFQREGLADCKFQAFPLAEINQFPALLKDNPKLKGLSVTIPYKQLVLPYIDVLSDEVKIIGAANSIKILNEELVAYNTDSIGFEKSFSSLLQPLHKNALVLGTGGASKAVQFVLNKLSIDFLLVSRSKPDEKKLISYSDINKEMMEKYQVIINCTPCGMWPNITDCPEIPYQFITPQHYVFDLIYKPEKTLFLSKAAAHGALVKNGYDMLIIQAEESWKIWNSDKNL